MLISHICEGSGCLPPRRNGFNAISQNRRIVVFKFGTHIVNERSLTWLTFQGRRSKVKVTASQKVTFLHFSLANVHILLKLQCNDECLCEPLQEDSDLQTRLPVSGMARQLSTKKDVSTVCTVQDRYNAVNFLQSPHNRHTIDPGTIDHPWGWAMGCLLWVWSLICYQFSAVCDIMINCTAL